MSMWNLRLRGPRGQTAALQVDADATLQSFYDLAIQQLKLKSSADLMFRSGFPPQPVTASATALIKDVFTNNDSVVVALASSAGKVAAAPGPTPKRGMKAASTGTSRAASKRAPQPKARGVHSLTQSTGRPATAKRKITGQGFQLGSSLDDDGVSEAAAEAERLPAYDDSGDDDDGGAQQSRRKYRRTRAINLSSKEDVEVALVNAVSGQATDRAGKFFRAATRNAVEYQYQMTLANARLNAALSNKFEIQEVRTTRRTGAAASEDNENAAEMKVRFKEGVRKWREETVTLLQAVELQAIVKYVLLSGGDTGKEMLKPFNMAQVSPRVFWSMVRLYGGDIEAGLAKLLPDQDWSYLDTRTRTMSKKAKEAQANEEQWKIWKKRNSRDSDSPTQVESPSGAEKRTPSLKNEVIEVTSNDDQVPQRESSASTSQSATRMDSRQQYRKPTPALSSRQATTSALRDAAAQAALSRFDLNARSGRVVAAFNGLIVDKQARSNIQTAGDSSETEDEEDVEETTTVYCDECNKARILSLEEAARADIDGDKRWTCVKLAAAGRQDGCDALDDEVVQIAGKEIASLLAANANISTRKDLANAQTRTTLRALVSVTNASLTVVESKLDKMIDEARLDEVNDLMSEIAGGNTDIVGALELQKLGTPADLLTTPSDMILESLAQWQFDISLATVEGWQKLAQEAVDTFGWLREWHTV